MLARGVATANYTPGTESLPYHVYAAAQGLHAAVEYWGLPVMKTAWDLALYSMALGELQPKSIIELGTGSGGSAMWLADEARKQGVALQVHTLDIKSAEEIATAHRLSLEQWQQMLAQRGVTFHGRADLSKERSHPLTQLTRAPSLTPLTNAPSLTQCTRAMCIELPVYRFPMFQERKALPDKGLLSALPHPWLVIDDAHVNTARIASHIFKRMCARTFLEEGLASKKHILP